MALPIEAGPLANTENDIMTADGSGPTRSGGFYIVRATRFVSVRPDFAEQAYGTFRLS
jgi:hypothetical protein